MQPFEFSGIAHANHLFWSPLSPEKLENLIPLLRLDNGARVVDFGCGNGEMLARICERYAAEGLGLDISPYALKQAERRSGAHVQFRRQKAEELLPERRLDLAMCIGATGIFGGYESALEQMPKYVKPGGLILIGEGYWRKDPAEDYLELLEATRGEMRSHAETALLARQKGLTLLYSCASSDDEWDVYEGLYLNSIEEYAQAKPDIFDIPETLDRIRKWHAGYLRWGRETLGFGLYLLRVS